jgi:hypothetical protein
MRKAALYDHSVVSSPRPIFVAADKTRYSGICDECQREKGAPGTDRAWAPGDDLSDVRVEGDLPLDQDEAWVECEHGHRHLVLREGSERAKNFA